MRYVLSAVAIAILLFSSFADASQVERRFQPLRVEEGLSHNNVYSIIQDHRGFIYIGTQDGLVRYDGNNCVSFYHDPVNENSLSSSNFGKLLEDKAGHLWMGTWGGGLNRYDLETGIYTHYFHDSSNPSSLSANFIIALLEDPSGNIWVATPANGLDLLDVRRGIFIHYRHEQGNPNSLSDNNVRTLAWGPNGKLWIGTFSGGLNRLDPVTGEVKHFLADPGNPNAISHNSVCALHLDSRENLWIGTRGGGLDQMDLKSGKITRFVYDPENPFSINSMNINAILEDSYGYLWVGTFHKGLNRYDPRTGKFIHFKHHDRDIFSLSHDRVEVLIEDKGGVLWVGTRGGGVSILDLKPSHFKHWNYPFLNPVESENRNTYAITEDQEGNLWIGTDGGGVNKFSTGSKPGVKGFINYQPQKSRYAAIEHNRVWSLLEDRTGHMWVGTYRGIKILNKQTGSFSEINAVGDPEIVELLKTTIITRLFEDNDGSIWVGSSSGLFHLSPNEGKYNVIHFLMHPWKSEIKSMSLNYITSIYRDTKNVLWIGSDSGLYEMQFDAIRGTGLFKKYSGYNDSTGSLARRLVTVIHEDYRHNLWIGTDSGLNLLERQSGAWRRFTREEGLPNNAIQGILEDDHHYLWISTHSGLCRFDTGTFACKNFDIHDGLICNGFNDRSFFKRKNGEMFFGCSRGLISFIPGDVEENPHIPPVVLTSLNVWGVDKRFNYRQLTEGSIKLTAKENGFYFQFAALDYTDPKKNQFAYMLEGFDHQWNHSGYRRFGAYTNIPPGYYTLKVKGSNNDGIWNETGVSLKIRVLPSFWQTVWFQWTLLVFAALLVVHLYRARVRNIRRQQRKLEELVGKRTAQMEVANRLAQQQRAAAEAASNAKSEFLARMSHEIRTPLNSILGFNEILLETKLDSQQEDYVRTVQRSGEILLTLINEVLDFSRVESGHLSLESEEFDPRALAYDVCQLVSPRLGDQPVELLCNVSPEVPQFIQGDAGKFQQVLTNLMGNAVKFTREGEIQLTLTAREEGEDIHLQVEVRDTGIGVSKDQQKVIFEVFQQADGSTNRKYGGSGLGLAISRRIALLMGGDIWIESQFGKGSTFYFTSVMKKSAKQIETLEPPRLVGKKILLVDDNTISLKIITRQLESSGFEVIALSDSRLVLDALEQAQTVGTPFHLCIIDGVMPFLDGHTIAAEIHNAEPPIASIPLLALSTSEKKNYLYARSGFDAFLTKPVHPAKLRDMVVQLLKEHQAPQQEEPEPTASRAGKVTVNGGDEMLVTHDTAEIEILLDHKTSSLHILVAEDHQVNRKLIRHILDKAGYKLDLAENGREALEMYITDPGRYSLILMDIQMPEMNGVDATTAIRQWEKQHLEEGDIAGRIPIIALTAQVIKGEQERCFNAGMDDFLSKPIKRELLLDMIEKWTNQKTKKEKAV